MFKRYLIIFIPIIFLLCSACENKPASPVEQPDGTFLWNGFNLIRKDIYWYEDVDVSVLNKDNTELEITLTADKLYNYGEPYEVEVLLDGKWYRAPFSSGAFIQPLYTIDPNNSRFSRTNFSCNPVFACGILPAGQYRIVKEFTVPDTSQTSIYLSKEFAKAEFTVEETLGSEDKWIETMRESYQKTPK